MQVLIPIASRTQFFPEDDYFFPKPLIEVNGKPLIERVISGIKKFIESPKFIFVVDGGDCAKFSLDKLLVILGGSTSVVVRKNTETLGALCSALLAIDYIDLKKPLLITNCDTVFNFKIKDEIGELTQIENDAGVFTFKSVHPRWSYVSSSVDSNIDQVFEKEVVSNDAIAGLYYFKSAEQFIQAGKEVILNGVTVNNRYYISSTINQIILRGGRARFFRLKENQVHILNSPKAIEYFMSQPPNIKSAKNFRVNVIIPAAGLGTRFLKKGWKKPKPFIDVCGRSMLEQVILNLTADYCDFHILLRDQHITEYSDEVSQLKKIGAGIFAVPKLTEGTACTVLAAEQVINNDTMLMIANSDQILDFNISDYVEDCLSRNLDGSILVFKNEAKDPKWSFAKLSEDGFVTEVAEKKAISDLATVGIYLFKTGSSFVKGAIEMIVANERVNGEFYTCPVYNYLIASGMKIGVYKIDPDNMHGIGTPDDLVHYLNIKKSAVSADAP